MPVDRHSEIDCSSSGGYAVLSLLLAESAHNLCCFSSGDRSPAWPSVTLPSSRRRCDDTDSSAFYIHCRRASSLHPGQWYKRRKVAHTCRPTMLAAITLIVCFLPVMLFRLGFNLQQLGEMKTPYGRHATRWQAALQERMRGNSTTTIVQEAHKAALQSARESAERGVFWGLHSGAVEAKDVLSRTLEKSDRVPTEQTFNLSQRGDESALKNAGTSTPLPSKNADALAVHGQREGLPYDPQHTGDKMSRKEADHRSLHLYYSDKEGGILREAWQLPVRNALNKGEVLAPQRKTEDQRESLPQHTNSVPRILAEEENFREPERTVLRSAMKERALVPHYDGTNQNEVRQHKVLTRGSQAMTEQEDAQHRDNVLAALADAQERNSFGDYALLQVLDKLFVPMTKHWICNVKK